MKQSVNFYLQKAIQLAIDSVEKYQGGPFGALIVKNDNIISEGYNQVTHRKNPILHAEIIAIENACKVLDDFDLSGYTLYSSCEPCPMCLGAIYWARLDHIYFAASRQQANIGGFDDEWIYQDMVKSLKDRAIPTEQIEMEYSLEPFQRWIAKADHICY